MRDSVLAGGKRLRPLLVLAACGACRGAPEPGLDGACAVELIHAYSLVHDDLPAMDDDDLRRGRPSCHKAFGEAAAILAGDALLTLAFEVLAGETAAADAPQAAVGRLRAVAELARAAGHAGLVGGQSLDLYTPAADLDSLQALERIHRGKTAALFRASAVIGGLLGGGSEEQIACLERYGTALGLAFQHIDDALDEEHARFGQQALARGAMLLERAQQEAAAFGQRGQGLSDLTELVSERLEKARDASS
jgi:geranylgeranyl pyrophosphate synthase